MWGLFTKALTLATSTVRVSVINTSANFMVTALLGAVVFGEELPGQYFTRLHQLALAADDEQRSGGLVLAYSSLDL
jgi:hypothetical protein